MSFDSLPVGVKNSIKRMDIFKLTKCEKVIAIALESNHTTEELANAVCLSEKTVKMHLTNIMRKVGARNRVELYAKLYAMPREHDLRSIPVVKCSHSNVINLTRVYCNDCKSAINIGG